jgi:hypothetical protein
MIIELTDEYRAKTIPHNVVLETLRPVVDFKTGAFVRMDWQEVGFYATLNQAIGAIPGDIVLDQRVEDIEALRRRMEATAAQLDALLNVYRKGAA